MNLGDISASGLTQLLRAGELNLRTGPFTFRIQSSIPSIAEGLQLLYAQYPLSAANDFADFAVHLMPAAGLRRWYRPQVKFTYDGESPFEPLPLDHAFPLLEWAMNWCISTQAHHFLILHSAVIERDGYAVILPAPPGSGKSTLCTGLISRGWRLLSDELALISLDSGSIAPLCRPISLKNQSLDIIKTYVPDAIFNRVTHDTSKGSVTHMKVPDIHLKRIQETAQPRWVVFPKYVPNAPAEMRLRSRASSLLELGRNSFNYIVLGRKGFEVLASVVESSESYDFEYSQLDDAVEAFDALAQKNLGGNHVG